MRMKESEGGRPGKKHKGREGKWVRRKEGGREGGRKERREVLEGVRARVRGKERESKRKGRI